MVGDDEEEKREKRRMRNWGAASLYTDKVLAYVRNAPFRCIHDSKFPKSFQQEDVWIFIVLEFWNKTAIRLKLMYPVKL